PRHRHEDPGRPAAYADRTLSAEVLDRRMAAIVERAEGRYVAGGAAARSAGRSGEIPGMATAAAAEGAGPHLPVGAGRAGCSRFRSLDEDGYAIYRQLVVGTRLEDSAADHPESSLGERSALSRHAPAAHTGRSCARAARHRRAARRPFCIPQRIAFERISPS